MTTVLLAILFFTVGLTLIIKGGDAFVDASVFLAEVTGIPKIVVGATVVSLATTMPELLVSILATLHGSDDMAVGNAVGTVACNIGLIMGLSLLLMPSAVNRRQLLSKGGIMLIATAFLGAFCLNGRVSLIEGVILIGILISSIWTNVKSVSGRRTSCSSKHRANGKEFAENSLKFFLGAASILVGADLLVENGTVFARLIGVPESIIGLTLVAVGTSLPELATTMTAIKKRESALSVGNILGANIIDITLILGLCAFTRGEALPVTPHTYLWDIPITFALMLITVLPGVLRGKLTKKQGAVLLTVYAAYVVSLLFQGIFVV